MLLLWSGDAFQRSKLPSEAQLGGVIVYKKERAAESWIPKQVWRESAQAIYFSSVSSRNTNKRLVLAPPIRRLLTFWKQTDKKGGLINHE